MNKLTVTYRLQRSLIVGVASLVLLSVAGVGWADTWTGTVDDLWSTNGNWQDGTAPTSTDSVTFDAGDTGGTNLVDANFTITGLEYLGNGIHTTNLMSGSLLQIDGPASVGIGDGAMVTWTGNGSIGIGSAGSLQSWNVGVNNKGAGTNTSQLTITDITVNALVNDLAIGWVTSNGAASGSLALGSNSTVNLGTVATPVPFTIGWNQVTDPNLAGNATGVFTALDPQTAADLRLSELNVGRGTRFGTSTGTLEWNQTEAIHATDVYFGRGNSTGVLDVPTGGVLHLGSNADPLSNLRIAHNDAGGGTASADLDFMVTNPTFTADISGDLSVGRVTSSGAAFGSLRLGSNSTVNLGTVATPATLNIGWNQVTDPNLAGNANGVLDTTAGSFTAELSTVNIARTSNRGTATGEFILGSGAAVDANTVNVGLGAGASGTLTILADALTFTGTNTALNFGTGDLQIPGGNFTVGSAVDPVSALRIGYNNFGAGTATTDIDLTATNPVFTAHIGNELAIGWVTSNGAASGSLALGSNSTVNLGTVATPVPFTIGWNQVTDPNLAGNATGVFTALDPQTAADLRLSELNVGRGTRFGTSTGTLEWNQTEAIHATDVYFGRGNSTGVLDVPTGGVLHLGSNADPLSNLRIAHNDAGGGTASADLDFMVTNPTFTADISGDLSVGRVTSSGAAFGSLRLGSNSTVNLGTVATPATLNIGWNQVTDPNLAGNANGVLDTTAGSFTAELSTVNIARTSNRGTATGEFILGSGAAVDANTVNVGLGAGASGTLTILADALTFTGTNTALNFGTGDLQIPGGNFTVGSAVDPVSALRIGYNNFGAGTATTDIDLTATNPVFTAHIGNELAIGWVTSNGAASGSLALGSNSTVNLGTVATPVPFTIGWNQVTDPNLAGNATGVFTALDPQTAADLRLSELNVGRGTRFGTSTGTLEWNQTEAIHATDVYFGRGNSTGVLDVPTGGVLHLGSNADPLSNLRIAHNDAGGGTASADLDFMVTNPTFTADISGDLSVGRVTSSGAAFGSLRLGSNSTVNLGTVATPATLNIGWNQVTDPNLAGNANGVFNASNGNLQAHLSNLNVGRTAGRGTASGELTISSNSLVTATTGNIGIGSNATGTLNLEGGQLIAETINASGPGSSFNFTDGRLGLGGEMLATGTFNGTLDQRGGTLAPGFSRTDTSISGLATVNGDFNLYSAGTLEIELMGTNPGSEFDQLIINGGIDLNADIGVGGLLELLLDFAPSVGDGFTIVQNDGTDLVNGTFFGLPEGATFNEVFGGQIFTFDITYLGDTGNDIVLNVVSIVPVPPAVWLFGTGLIGLVGISRRKRVS